MKKFDSDGIYTRNFWPGEDTTKKFILSVVARSKSSNKNVTVTSVFPKKPSFFEKAQKSLKYRVLKLSDREYLQKISYGLEKPRTQKNMKNIWYTGENRRPPEDNEAWDAFLSFELDTSIEKNIYLPFWVTRLGQNVEEVQEKIDEMLKPRKPIFNKTKFACSFVGNPEPMRLRFIKEFARFHKIDLFGSAFNNRVQDKAKILEEYRFSVCFENDLYPGYVTEKAIESWQSEAIPIWWGLDNAKFLNPGALIDVSELGISDSLRQISILSTDETRMYSIRSQPILSKRFDTAMLISSLKSLLS
jgi:hypothetical protein